LGSTLQECLATLQLGKASGTEARNRARLRGQLLPLMRHVLRQEMLGSLTGRLATVIGSTAPVLLLWFGTWELLAHRLTIGQFVAFNALLTFIFMPVQILLSQNISLQGALAALRRLTELLELPDEARLEVVPARQLPRRRDLRLEAITFGYRSERPVLCGVDLTVREGETVAIVGPSGEGKTTLLRLLLRLHPPDHGRVLLGGVDVRELPLDEYRARMAVTFQEPFLVGGTIEENLRIGRPGATRAQLEEALARACALDFVLDLPRGLGSTLGEGGATLSAGQKMRLALARAVVRDAPIVLFDEPTSALDAQTEAAVLRNLRAYLAGRTAILVAHHQSAIGIADRVCVLTEGRLTEACLTDSRLTDSRGLGPHLANVRAGVVMAAEETA